MSDNYVKDPAEFLLDSGLLFEINRRILHPLGLALAVEQADDGSYSNNGSFSTNVRVLDCRDDPEGLIFDEATLAEGQAKIERFVAENLLQQKLMVRRTRLGYLIQTIPPEPEPPFKIG